MAKVTTAIGGEGGHFHLFENMVGSTGKASTDGVPPDILPTASQISIMGMV